MRTSTEKDSTESLATMTTKSEKKESNHLPMKETTRMIMVLVAMKRMMKTAKTVMKTPAKTLILFKEVFGKARTMTMKKIVDLEKTMETTRDHPMQVLDKKMTVKM